MLPKRDNYAIQAEEARLRFLIYDQAAMPVAMDGDFLFLRFCGSDYRICRADGHLFRRVGEDWLPADSHGEVLTVYDYLCRDFRELEQAIGDVCLQMESADDLDALMERYQSLLDESDAMDADN